MSELTHEELYARNQIIYMPNKYHAKQLPPEKQKCHWCNATFLTDYDMNAHLGAWGRYPHDKEKLEKLHRIHWKPSDYGDGDICHIDKVKALDPQLAKAIETQSVNLGDHNYSLSQNGQWVKRRKRSL